MSTDIIVSQKRNGTLINRNIAMQLDDMSQQEASYYGGSSPYFRYAGYVLGPEALDFQLGDLLVDKKNTDNKTNKLKAYRLITDNEWFPDGHWEIVMDRVIGN